MSLQPSNFEKLVGLTCGVCGSIWVSNIMFDDTEYRYNILERWLLMCGIGSIGFTTFGLCGASAFQVCKTTYPYSVIALAIPTGVFMTRQFRAKKKVQIRQPSNDLLFQ